MLLFTRYYYHNRNNEDNTYVACSMHIVKMKGIQSLLRKPEQEEPFGRITNSI